MTKTEAEVQLYNTRVDLGHALRSNGRLQERVQNMGIWLGLVGVALMFSVVLNLLQSGILRVIR